jgi:hypothetical protein
MTMLEERPTKLIPLQQALKELDSSEAVADRKKRAAEWGKRLAGDERNQMIGSATRDAIGAALAPLNTPHLHWDTVSEHEKKEANRQATQNIDALVVRQAEEELRRRDERALYADPDRLEEQRIWNAYCHQVSAATWQQGNQSAAWIARWQAMIADRAAAEEYGDPTGAIDARLLRHVGVPFPVLPDAAWAAADTIPMSGERTKELERLEQKYPGTRPGTPVTDAPTRRRARK